MNKNYDNTKKRTINVRIRIRIRSAITQMIMIILRNIGIMRVIAVTMISIIVCYNSNKRNNNTLLEILASRHCKIV